MSERIFGEVSEDCLSPFHQGEFRSFQKLRSEIAIGVRFLVKFSLRIQRKLKPVVKVLSLT